MAYDIRVVKWVITYHEAIKMTLYEVLSGNKSRWANPNGRFHGLGVTYIFPVRNGALFVQTKLGFVVRVNVSCRSGHEFYGCH